jgi:hypothetical protein
MPEPCEVLPPTTRHGQSLMLDLVYATNRARRPSYGEATMTIDPVVISPLIALIAGILILLMPRLLNYVVAIYLIAIGIIGLANHFH